MLKAEMEKAQKALAAAEDLDITGDGEVSREVREAQLRVEALGAAAQAAHHDAAAAEQRAQAALAFVIHSHCLLPLGLGRSTQPLPYAY